MIAVSGVTVRYGSLVAVADVSLRVPEGCILAVSGPSGAGKSSLLWAIAGALRPDAGTVTIGGVEVRTRADAASQGLVLIPQGNGLARSLTARENLTVPLLAAPAIAGALGKEVDGDGALERVDRLVDTALADVGLQDSGNHLVEELSGGEQQRVAVARGLAQQGRAILADESTSELDGSNRERVVELLQQQAHYGAAVIIATHDPEVAAVADGHAQMDEGHLTWPRPI